jgi:hypothetical protein
MARCWRSLVTLNADAWASATAGRCLRSDSRPTASCILHDRAAPVTPSEPFHSERQQSRVVAAGSEVQLLNLPSLSSATNHNGGAIHFGTDSKLYIAVGENANSANAPSLSTTLGKILRINADGSIPADNPFVSQTSGINQAIWARLLSPCDRPRSNGSIHLNDVGWTVGRSEPGSRRLELRLAAGQGNNGRCRR